MFKPKDCKENWKECPWAVKENDGNGCVYSCRRCRWYTKLMGEDICRNAYDELMPKYLAEQSKKKFAEAQQKLIDERRKEEMFELLEEISLKLNTMNETLNKVFAVVAGNPEAIMPKQKNDIEATEENFSSDKSDHVFLN